MKKFINTLFENRYNIFFSIILILMITFVVIILPMEDTKEVVKSLEERTFDVRQKIISKNRKASDEIVIISVDDPSYEYLIDTFGDWPIPRHVHAQLIDYVQQQNPKFMALDFIFIKSLNRVAGSDLKLAQVYKKYSNTYAALNFDDYDKKMRKPPILHKKFTTEFVNNSKTVTPHKFTNSRIIMEELLNATDKLAPINLFHGYDGVIRSIPFIVSYPRYTSDNYDEKTEEYYLYLTAKLAVDYLNKYKNANISKIEITPDNKIILGEYKIPITKEANTILNWYGKNSANDNYSFKHITFWEVIQSMEAKRKGETPILPDDTFKDKIVYVGTNIASLSDIKTIPISKNCPGVEIHATLLNNILDNSLIHEASLSYNILICIILSSLAIFTVLKIRSVLMSIILFSGLIGAYLYFTTYAMEKYNVWVWIIVPLVFLVFSFIACYIIKYLIKSRDFEHTYKLATTDGLTELYNHRFFQEQLRNHIKYAEKYKSHFSLILIDIDFFKKFNDKYGHQAGDAVLKQVASVLKKSVRANDYVCRYGGEEMAILLNHIPEDIAIKTATKICETIANRTYKLSSELEVNVTISLGVSTYPECGKTPTELIEYADKCLYKAKENGRNQVGKM